MHRALKIRDVLLDVLDHFSLPYTRGPDRIRIISNLAALARTCRAFKEPALNLL